MKNKEKYHDEIFRIACLGSGVALVGGKPTPCNETRCGWCDLGCGSCGSEFEIWCESEYIEPKPKLTKRERDFIDCIIDDFYIVNDGTGLFVHFWADDVALEIYDDLFKFIKSKESMSKKELLSLEVEK